MPSNIVDYFHCIKPQVFDQKLNPANKPGVWSELQCYSRERHLIPNWLCWKLLLYMERPIHQVNMHSFSTQRIACNLGKSSLHIKTLKMFYLQNVFFMYN